MGNLFAICVTAGALAYFGTQSLLAANIALIGATPDSHLTPAPPGHPQGPRCNLRLSGDVEEGDLSKLKRIVQTLRGEEHHTYHLCLNSGGGSFSEGVNIARYLLEHRKYSIGTVIEEGQSCLSACAIIFMAGNILRPNSRFPSRQLHVGGRLGFHAPFLDGLPEGSFDRKTVINAFVVAQRGIDDLMTVFGIPTGGPTTSGSTLVAPSLFQLMLSHGVESFFEIDTIDKAGRWAIQLYGYQHPSYKPDVDFDALRVSCSNFHWWAKDQYAAKRPSKVRSPTQIETDHGADGKRMKHAIPLDDTGNEYCVLLGSFTTSGPPWFSSGVLLALHVRGNQFASTKSITHFANPWTILPPETRLSAMPRHRSK